MAELKSLLLALLGVVAAADAPRLTFAGLGAIRIGMSAEALTRIADVRRADLEHEERWPCRYVRFDYATIGVRIGASGVVAVEIADPRHRTLSGIGVGSSVDEVRAVYGRRAMVTGSRFVMRSKDRRRALLIETDGRVVTRLIAGAAHVAERVAPCL
jgi:hypothetical protein